MNQNLGDELALAGDFVWSAALARAVDEETTERIGLSAAALVESAGRAVADAVLEHLLGDDDEEDELEPSPIIVLAGKGNNGADALVAARWLAEAGQETHVFVVGEGEPSPGHRSQRAILEALGHPLRAYRPGCLAAFADREPIVIDGVFGLGFRGPMRPDSLAHQALVEADALADRTVVAVDLPSGLDADLGTTDAAPLPADLTVTFGAAKPVHVLAPARDQVGEVLVADIGFPAQAVARAAERLRPSLVVPDDLALLADDPWSRLPRSSHKYDRGHVLVIGGSPGKTGAPLLSALAALASGAGWATVAMPSAAFATLKGDVPREVVFEELFHGNDLDPLRLERLLTSRSVRAVAVGPGMVDSPLSEDALAVLVAFATGGLGDGSRDDKSGGAPRLVVFDAGATHDLQHRLARLKDLAADPAAMVATPHPGEWLRLGASEADAPLSPSGLARAQELAASMGMALLYKGATPVLLTGDPELPGFVHTSGTVTLARAGTGDVLTGVIAAHGAIGLSATLATLRGQALVSKAAALAAAKRGPHGVLARDLIVHLGRAADIGD